MTTGEQQEVLEQIEQHLEKADLSWLLGAGVSFDANIPLMYPLTERIAHLLQAEDQPRFEVYNTLRGNLPSDAHIEHVLSHLGDIISLTDRSKDNKIKLDDTELEKENLEALFQSIVKHIRTTIRFGFKKGVDEAADSVGTSEAPIVDISRHREFVRSIFSVSRAGVENRRAGVRFFTLNYDTLLEDALSFERVDCVDGFTGGAIGFWNSENFNSKNTGNEAVVVKLHGSIDWRFDQQKASLNAEKIFMKMMIFPMC